jgi:fatty-acyl-CoA synthase
VTGRLDDLMSVAGRNVYARDVELCLTAVSGVRPGGCAVVDVDTRLVAVIEPRAGHPELTAVAADVRAASRAGAGVLIDECVFVPRGRLPKTPSGKVQRFRCRELAASGGGDGAIRVRL